MYYLCLCDCGTTTSIPRNRLTTHNTQSCGCLKAEQKIHELGWDHPGVANPRRRELYAQKRAMGYVRVRSEAFYARQRARHQERRQEDPEALRAAWSRNTKAYRDARPGLATENTRRRRARIAGAPINDFTPAQWKEIQTAFDHRCAYCGKRAKGHLTQDHITPLSKGGPNTANNIVPACLSCNSKKNDRAILKPVQPVLLLLSHSRIEDK
jgi:5-methylcytosine-specific restriction endonuclease McrA